MASGYRRGKMIPGSPSTEFQVVPVLRAILRDKYYVFSLLMYLFTIHRNSLSSRMIGGYRRGKMIPGSPSKEFQVVPVG